MAFIVENGTGLSAANALASVEAVTAWLTDRGDDAAWAAATTAARQAAIVKATDYIANHRRYRWRGTKGSYAQALPWPRTGATEEDGQTVPSDVVPARVVAATAFLAARSLAGTDLQPDLEHGGMVKSESIGPVSVTYRDGAPPESVIMAVDGIVAPLLRNPMRGLTVRPWRDTAQDTTEAPAFATGMHDNA